MKNIIIHKAPLEGSCPKVSIILLDWGCRERFHPLDWLTTQTVARDQYELIWVELYDRVVPEAMEKADWLITCNQTGMYHKHKGYNIGLLQARGDVITVCDSDAVFPPEFVASIIESFELNTREEPRPLVLKHHEQRSNHIYPCKLEVIEDVLRYDWVELWPNDDACVSVAKRDALGFGGFDEDESLRGYIYGPYDLGWRMVNAGLPEVWHDKVSLWHFANPHSNAKENKETWGEIAPPHNDFHARDAVEAFSTGCLLPLTMNTEVQVRRMAQRRIGTDYEAKFSRMADRVSRVEHQSQSAQQIELDRWYESENLIAEPLVTAIVSSYNAERFMRGLLEDLEAQTIADKIEIVVIDSYSPQGEAAIVREFQLRYANIRFMRTSLREQSHITLNRCIKAARGKYITLACTDDRHCVDAFEKMVAALENHFDKALVYADIAITEKENQVIESTDLKGFYKWPDYNRRTLFQVCYIGPQAMWRRDLHDKYGYFDETFLSAGDYELWLRFAAADEEFLHLPEVLGLYFLNPQGNEHGQRDTSNRESDIAIRRYWKAAWGERPPYGGNCFVPAEQGSHADATQLHPLGAMPLVSIIVPTHDRPDFLKDALNSILAQDYPHWEAIVVNDGGVDVEKITATLDPQGRIRHLAHSTNFGQVAAKNTGLRAARGEIVCYLDDDDRYLPNHLSTIVTAMRGTSNAFVYTDTDYVLEETKDGKRTEIARGNPLKDMAHTKEQLRIRNYIPINVWAHRRECLKVTGLFDEKLPSLEDWEFLLRIAQFWELHHIPLRTAEVWQRAQVVDNVSRKQIHTFLEVFKQIYARHEDDGNECIKIGRKEMMRNLESASAGQPVTPAASRESDYQRWIYKHSLQEIDAQLFAERMTLVWKQRPVFQLVLILESGEESRLADTLDSLGSQLYSEWRLTVIAGFPAPDAVFHELPQLCWIEASSATDRVAAINALITGADTGWLLLAPPGAALEPHTLIRCGDYVNLHPEWRLIYFDDDHVNATGGLAEPRFKPDFNLDLLRSTDYIGPCLLRADALSETGGYSCLAQVETYDMALRVLDQYGEQAIGHISDVLLHLPIAWKPMGNEGNAREAVNQHLVRHGIQARVDEGFVPGAHRVVYTRAGDPLVSIIIPNRDKLEFLQSCVESIFEKTSYTHFEILIVDNQSTDPDVLDYYEELRQRFSDRLRVLSFDAEFNFSAMNNLAARQANGEYLLLLNNDTQIVQSEWLECLLSYGQRSDVGIVGPRLVYPESGKLQHAGVVLGLSSIADHPFNGVLSISDPGYMNRAQVDQNYSAVTAACLMVRRSLYEQVGGMDEERLKVLFNDIDLCLKVRELGYKIVWTPYATAVHHGSTSIKSESTDLMKLALGNERAKQERGVMMERWLPQLANDPAYNRHLSFKPPGYQVEGTVVIDWDTNFHDRPRILGSPLSGGSGEYRVIAPLRALSRAGLAQCDVVQAGTMFQTRVLMPVEIERAKPDTLVLHSAIDDKQMEALALYQQFNQDVLRVLTLDDLLSQVPKDNSFYRYSYKDAKPRLRKALALCDRLIVSTEPLAALCRPMIEDIHIIPNRLESSQWGNLNSLRRQGKKPRVGWAGAQQHKGDLALIVDVVKQTAAEVDWVFFGMCPDELRPYVSEFHDFVLSFYDYPA
ncbi:MAG: glycosyltransferase, partial [Burkholderiales bacterium]|nr:glycosyltransferase [Burkholderiales bacterium]